MLLKMISIIIEKDRKLEITIIPYMTNTSTKTKLDLTIVK